MSDPVPELLAQTVVIEREDQGPLRRNPAGVRSSRWVSVTAAARSALTHARRRASSVLTPSFRELQIVGQADDTSEEVLIRYIGTAKNYRFLIGACTGQHRVSSEATLRPFAAAAAVRSVRGEDVLLVDADSPFLSPNISALRLPSWLRQRRRLPESWDRFVDELPRGTRREVARCLRKYGYHARVTASDAAFERFYRDLYRPHVARRFGEGAFLLDEPRFQRERVGSQVVELLHDGAVVAANVIRTAGPTMWMLWYGLSDTVTARGLKGATDVLDYLTLLHAWRLGVRQADFGRSRPLLNDGALTYKAKWEPELRLGVLQNPPLLIVPRNLRTATLRLLSRNQWVTRYAGALTSVVLLEQDCVSADEVMLAARRCKPPGVASVRICASHGFGFEIDEQAWSARGVELVDLAAASNPLHRYVGIR